MTVPSLHNTLVRHLGPPILQPPDSPILITCVTAASAWAAGSIVVVTIVAGGALGAVVIVAAADVAAGCGEHAASTRAPATTMMVKRDRFTPIGRS